jgi:tRNA U34 5-methylaminomethyl-2-thiouridine-forming methyltransferase MnmC
MHIQREIIVTGDGSRTIHIPEWNENYHSSHGALQEANHVFLKNGLEAFRGQDSVSILEVGFGTGLNAVLTLQDAERSTFGVNYYGLEAFPVSAEELAALDYGALLDSDEMRGFYEQIHAANWDQLQIISPSFSLQKIHRKLEDMQWEPAQFDLIYFDAFGPRTQAEMWQLSNFQGLFAALKPGGALVTYCAQGQVKRDLKTAGFTIEPLPGPPGKREMTRAWKTVTD